VFVLIVALLGVSVAVLPAVAGSETGPTVIKAENHGGAYGETHSWSPERVEVSEATTLTMSNPTTVSHGVEWRPGAPATPSCTGVVVGNTPAESGTNWSGTCSFSRPGTYTFWCTVHHEAMAGTITVSAVGTTTTTQTAGGSTTTTTSTPTKSPPGGTLTSESTLGAPALVGAAGTVKLAAGRHGKSVRGSLDVPQVGVGGRLEVDLLAKRAALANAAGSTRVRVGRFIRSSLPPGKLSFTVPVNARARRALARHHRLPLTVKIVLTPLHGTPSSAARSIVLHP
jgi:plastocyanin